MAFAVLPVMLTVFRLFRLSMAISFEFSSSAGSSSSESLDVLLLSLSSAILGIVFSPFAKLTPLGLTESNKSAYSFEGDICFTVTAGVASDTTDSSS